MNMEKSSKALPDRVQSPNLDNTLETKMSASEHEPERPQTATGVTETWTPEEERRVRWKEATIVLSLLVSHSSLLTLLTPGSISI